MRKSTVENENYKSKKVGGEEKTKYNERKWVQKVADITSYEDKGIHLVSELYNFVLEFGLKSYWYSDGDGNSMDDAVLDLDTDLRNYYYDEYEDKDTEKEVLEESVMNLVAIALQGYENVAIFHRYGKPVLIGNREFIKENFEGENASDYGLEESFWF